jgi:hypothetical protein
MILVVLGVTTLSVALAGKDFTYRQRIYIAFVSMVLSLTGTVLAVIS